MISNIAKLAARPDTRDKLLAALEQLVGYAGSEPGTLVYNLRVDNSDDAVFWNYQLYADAAAAKAHSSSDSFRAVFGPIPDLLREPLEVIRSTALRTEPPAAS